jgi:hypothetical protein
MSGRGREGGTDGGEGENLEEDKPTRGASVAEGKTETAPTNFTHGTKPWGRGTQSWRHRETGGRRSGPTDERARASDELVPLCEKEKPLKGGTLDAVAG